LPPHSPDTAGAGEVPAAPTRRARHDAGGRRTGGCTTLIGGGCAVWGWPHRLNMSQRGEGGHCGGLPESSGSGAGTPDAGASKNAWVLTAGVRTWVIAQARCTSRWYQKILFVVYTRIKMTVRRGVPFTKRRNSAKKISKFFSRPCFAQNEERKVALTTPLNAACRTTSSR